MSKILALYTNEMIKLSRKLSVWILIALMTTSCILVPFLTKRMYQANLSYSDESESLDKTQLTKIRDSLRESFGDQNQYVQHDTIRFTIQNEIIELFATYLSLDEDDVYSYASYICMNTILDNYNFDKYPLNGSLLADHAYTLYMDETSNLCFMNTIPFSERDNAWYDEYIDTTERLDLANAALFSHDMDAMIKLVARKNENNGTFSLSIWKDLAAIDPEGRLSIKESRRLAEALIQREKYRKNLEMGVDSYNYSYIPLTSARRAQIEDSLLILDYQITHDKLPNETTELGVATKQVTHRAARFFLVIMMIIIAGSSISQELATGSIKSLIIAPVKRWKIFTAKLLSIFTWGLFGSILITFLSTLSTMICIGSSSLPPYYYVSGGAVKVMPHLLFTLLYFLVDNISLFIYILTAFMISCLTRNTGISVGVSAGLLLGASISTTLNSMFGHQLWIDFLPFSNMDLLSNVFPHLGLIGYLDSDMAGLFGVADYHAIPFSFSVTYLIVLSLILLLIAYDGFVRRDIQ
ncbi:MAG: ABC transporter permease subunit [Clostridiales bacterium]|nr:ABC transporter permease subunit [Clostridiales bacterium]